MRVKDATHWRPWFAWRPVHIEDRWIWLERKKRCVMNTNKKKMKTANRQGILDN